MNIDRIWEMIEAAVENDVDLAKAEFQCGVSEFRDLRRQRDSRGNHVVCIGSSTCERQRIMGIPVHVSGRFGQLKLERVK